MSNEPFVVHGLSDSIAPIGPFLRRLHVGYEIIYLLGEFFFSQIGRQMFFFWVYITCCPNEIVEKTTSQNNMVLLFNWVECMTSQDGSSRLQHAKGTFDYVTSLGVFKIKILLIILGSHWTGTKFLEMVSNTSIRCEKTISIGVPTIYQVVLTCLILKRIRKVLSIHPCFS